MIVGPTICLLSLVPTAHAEESAVAPTPAATPPPPRWKRTRHRPEEARWRIAFSSTAWFGQYVDAAGLDAFGGYVYHYPPGFYAVGGMFTWTRWTPAPVAPEFRVGWLHYTDDGGLDGSTFEAPLVSIGVRAWPKDGTHLYVAARAEFEYFLLPGAAVGVGMAAFDARGPTAELEFHLGGPGWFHAGLAAALHLGWTFGPRLAPTAAPP